MIRTLLVIPLIICLTMPHYFILSFHQTYHTYKYGPDFSLILPVCAIIMGIFLSSILLNYIIGTFVLLTVSCIFSIICSIDLFIASLTDSSSHSYVYALLASCISIGMSQPNLVSVIGDQYERMGIMHCVVYVLINMFEICLATVLPLTPKLKYANNDTHCPIMDCYSLIYFVCFVLSCIGFVILMAIYLLRNDFVIQPLLHESFLDENVTRRLKNFMSIILPLVTVCVFFSLLEHEMFAQAKNLNRIISGISSVNDFELRIIYYFLTLLCLPIAVLLDKLKLNSFDKITVGCILICFASFYYGLVHSHVKKSFNKFKDGDSRLGAFELVNLFCDIRYNITPFNKHGISPYAEKIGPFYVNQSNFVMHIKDLTRNHGFQGYNTFGNFSLDPPLHGGLLITYVNFWHQDVVYYERKFRAVSGLALLRLIKEENVRGNICLKSSKLVSCGMAESKFMEIPSGRYSIMIDETVYGPYFFQNGEYYTFIILNVTKTDLYEIVPFLIIPPFNFSIYWHLLLYILMSLANGLIYAAGLNISSQIDVGSNKVLFINGLYVVYLFGWIVFHIIYDVAEIKLTDNMDFVTFILIGTTLWFYFGYRKNGPLLN